jgi:hypothetical protein
MANKLQIANKLTCGYQPRKDKETLRVESDFKRF